MMMWPGHHGEDFDMDTSRMSNVLHPHVPLAMSLCHVDYVKMQSSLQNHMYNPGAYEGILELRKEKSRDAARSRRGKENYEFYELAKLLPLPAAITSQLDKASIIRLTISYLKLRDFSGHGDPPWNRGDANMGKSIKGQCRSTMSLVQDVFECHQGTHILQSLDGFAFALSNDARFLYISETVSIYLGLSQVEMAGSSIFEYIHAHDHKELAEQLGLNAPKSFATSSSSSAPQSDESSTPNPTRSSTPMVDRVSVMSPNPSTGYDRCFCIRMKSTLTKRGVHFKSSGYRVVQIVAHLRPQVFYATPSTSSTAQKQLPPLLGLVGIAIALPPPTITELIIDNDMFITRLNPQFHTTYCEPRLSEMMDLPSEELVGKSLYDFCHAEDLKKLNKAHHDLLNKGQVLTDYYRLMNKHGGFVWLQTCATIICNAKNIDDQNIIAINYVLSGVEYPGCVMSVEQMKTVNKTGLCSDVVKDTPSNDFVNKPTFQALNPVVDNNANSNTTNALSSNNNSNKITIPSNTTATNSATNNNYRQETTKEGHSSKYYEKLQSNLPANLVKVIASRSENLDEVTFGESDSKNVGSKNSFKNSRRKMEKPKKRKRGLNEENDSRCSSKVSVNDVDDTESSEARRDGRKHCVEEKKGKEMSDKKIETLLDTSKNLSGKHMEGMHSPINKETNREMMSSKRGIEDFLPIENNNRKPNEGVRNDEFSMINLFNNNKSNREPDSRSNKVTAPKENPQKSKHTSNLTDTSNKDGCMRNALEKNYQQNGNAVEKDSHKETTCQRLSHLNMPVDAHLVEDSTSSQADSVSKRNQESKGAMHFSKNNFLRTIDQHVSSQMVAANISKNVSKFLEKNNESEVNISVSDSVANSDNKFDKVNSDLVNTIDKNRKNLQGNNKGINYNDSNNKMNNNHNKNSRNSSVSNRNVNIGTSNTSSNSINNSNNSTAGSNSNQLPGHGTTVHDLEAAMNKHLPISEMSSHATPQPHQFLNSGYFHPSVFGLPKGGKASSAIQWISNGRLMEQACPSSNYPVTDLSLLRSLYPGRESVIRSNIYNQRQQSQQHHHMQHQQLQYYNSEPQQSLLTPPGSEAYHSNDYSKTNTANNLFHGYLSYNGLVPNESYSVTPPSSASPHEASTSSFLHPAFNEHHQLEHPTTSSSYFKDNPGYLKSQFRQMTSSVNYHPPYDSYYYHQASNFNYPYPSYPMNVYNQYMTASSAANANSYLEPMKNL